MIQLNISSKPSQVERIIKLRSKQCVKYFIFICGNIIKEHNMKHGVQWHIWQNIANNQSNVLCMVSKHPHFVGLCNNTDRRHTAISIR